MKFLETIEGKLFAESYDFRAPRVQLSADMAVLTFQLFAKSTLMDMAYNCIEVYQREADGEWPRHPLHLVLYTANGCEELAKNNTCLKTD